MRTLISADRSKVLRYGITVVLLAFGVAWFFMLRPQTLGGPVAYVIVAGASMEPTYQDGDLILMRKPAEYAEGDIVAFTVPAGEPAAGARVIHRIVGRDEDGFLTRGDNTGGNDLWHPKADDIAGKGWLRLPGVGNYLQRLRAPLVLASLAAAYTIYAVMTSGKKRPVPEAAAARPWREWLRLPGRAAQTEFAAAIAFSAEPLPQDAPVSITGNATSSSRPSTQLRCRRRLSFPSDPRASYALAALVAVLVACLALTSFQSGKDPSVE